MLRGAIATLALTLLVPATAGAATCDKPAPAGRTTIKVVSGASTREVIVHVPKAYDGRTPVPLVFDLHGTYDDRDGQLGTSLSEAAGDRHGFAIAAANGSVRGRIAFNGKAGWLWNLPGTLQFGERRPPGAPDEVLFISDAIDAIGRFICLDFRRVFSMGYSNGGRSSSWFACAMANRIAAIGPVAGVRAGYPAASDRETADPRTCVPSQPVAVIAFHGTSDPIAPYSAGGGQDYQGYSVPVAMKRWADLNGCAAGVLTNVSTTVDRTAYGECRDGADVQLYTVNGGGHSWPGTPRTTPFGTTTQEINATELAFEFFARHPLPVLPAMTLSADRTRLTARRTARVTLTATWHRAGGDPVVLTAAKQRLLPLPGVTVRLLGRRGVTGPDGKVTLTVRPRGSGARRAVAAKDGYARASRRLVSRRA